jgi:hypothetical protein
VLRSNPALSNLFVFEEPASDFGGIAVVSGVTGLSVFGATVVNMGTGQVSYPPSWRDPSELGSCASDPGYPNPVFLPVGAMVQFVTAEPVAKVWSTALPAAMAQGTVQSTGVFVYTPSAGQLNPAAMEYIVFVNWISG